MSDKVVKSRKTVMQAKRLCHNPRLSLQDYAKLVWQFFNVFKLWQNYQILKKFRQIVTFSYPELYIG